ncbi:hypothetical protein [Enterobacter sp.]|uniref:hypothetical protein n=1 Tax=Enterobacter sp. TaxID=42895 RepID=UPI003D0BEF90
MIMRGAVFGQRKLEDPSERLLRMLNEHGDRVLIDKDGLVSTNYENAEIREEMNRQLEALATIKVCKDR